MSSPRVYIRKERGVPGSRTPNSRTSGILWMVPAESIGANGRTAVVTISDTAGRANSRRRRRRTAAPRRRLAPTGLVVPDVEGDLDGAALVLGGEGGEGVPPLLQAKGVGEHAGEIDAAG